MNDQLALIDLSVIDVSADTSSNFRATKNDQWQLDPAIREIGRRGVIMARRALQHNSTTVKVHTNPDTSTSPKVASVQRNGLAAAA